MLQQEEFIKRLKNFIENKQLSSSQFADVVQVPRSSISHLLSGRNKPSLEFVLKVVHSYPEIDINWLLFGKEVDQAPLTPQTNTSTSIQEVQNTAPQMPSNSSSEIEKIIVFYKNGVFKTYEPS